MKDIVSDFEQKRPEIVFEWKDDQSEAEGWVVINSLHGGAAGGGTRMRKGLDKKEVESLAKTMEIKFTVSGPAIGGAKSGINFDPQDRRKDEVLDRWYRAVIPLLKNYYGTGGDLNVDELKDVIPITSKYGLLHPQEGVVKGHFGHSVEKKIERLQYGVSKIVEDAAYTPETSGKFKVADLITGYGVAEAVRHYYDIWDGQVAGKKAIVQGWGNVGAAAGHYLTQMGAKIVGIVDRSGGLIDTDGFTEEQIKEFLLHRSEFSDRKDLMDFEEINRKIWDLDAEIFIPAAGSRLVTREQIKAMIDTNLEVISCGANVPFADEAIFLGPILSYADLEVAIIPDFIANCGMARTFAFLMESEIEITDDSVFRDTSDTIKNALKELYEICPDGTGLVAQGLEIALDKANAK
ncbi:MAG: Glu/Leu/Phe/Val dehydrogenase dimerization domain-containing protein [Cyclobacteriaceae bacterium]